MSRDPLEAWADWKDAQAERCSIKTPCPECAVYACDELYQGQAVTWCELDWIARETMP